MHFPRELSYMPEIATLDESLVFMSCQGLMTIVSWLEYQEHLKAGTIGQNFTLPCIKHTSHELYFPLWSPCRLSYCMPKLGNIHE